MNFRALLSCWLFCAASLLAQNPFEKAAQDREVARQRAFDRGQKNALPAAEQRESIGRLPVASVNAVRSENGVVVNQGAPSSATYNRVMETRRHFKNEEDPFLWNANDTFTDSPELAAKVLAEAEQIYPDLKKPNSAFAMRFKAINRWVDSRQPPLAKDSRRMLLVAHMTSLELTGGMAADSLGLAQMPLSEQTRTNAPMMIENTSFEIEVRGESALLPVGGKGKVTRGGLGSPDLIEWMDAAGGHQLLLPQQTEGRVSFSGKEAYSFQRILMLNGDYRVRFSLDKP